MPTRGPSGKSKLVSETVSRLMLLEQGRFLPLLRVPHTQTRSTYAKVSDRQTPSRLAFDQISRFSICIYLILSRFKGEILLLKFLHDRLLLKFAFLVYVVRAYLTHFQERRYRQQQLCSASCHVFLAVFSNSGFERGVPHVLEFLKSFCLFPR
jgi:hypothetical protein